MYIIFLLMNRIIKRRLIYSSPNYSLVEWIGNPSIEISLNFLIYYETKKHTTERTGKTPSLPLLKPMVSPQGETSLSTRLRIDPE